MCRIHEMCRPRPKVLNCELRDEELAPLFSRPIVSSQGTPIIHTDPDVFSRAFPLEALKRPLTS